MTLQVAGIAVVVIAVAIVLKLTMDAAENAPFLFIQ